MLEETQLLIKSKGNTTLHSQQSYYDIFSAKLAKRIYSEKARTNPSKTYPPRPMYYFFRVSHKI